MKQKNLFYLQSSLLFAGTLFAWGNVIKEFNTYFEAGGKIFQFVGCPLTNPVATPCFWGATAFLIALIWSLLILKLSVKYQVKNEWRLKWFLVASAIFGWGNVAFEFYKYFSAQMQPIVSCTGIIKNPIYSPCFTGSVIFFTSLILANSLSKLQKES